MQMRCVKCQQHVKRCQGAAVILVGRCSQPSSTPRGRHCAIVLVSSAARIQPRPNLCWAVMASVSCLFGRSVIGNCPAAVGLADCEALAALGPLLVPWPSTSAFLTCHSRHIMSFHVMLLQDMSPCDMFTFASLLFLITAYPLEFIAFVCL